MIDYKRFILANGLRVLVHEDSSTPMAVVNVCYCVGSRDESPEKTGFAHLFEHLMFGGTVAIPDFDVPLQMAGGENNAFTNNDITNYYDIVPAENLEVALWIESDRMSNLLIQPKTLKVQRKVVVEEFKETCLNEPYGDAWHHISELAYKTHPYGWPTIGKTPEHIVNAKIEEVAAFYKKYYQPSNAILTIAGNVQFEEVRGLVEKWFNPIPAGLSVEKKWPSEPNQKKLRTKTIHAQVPSDALYLIFHVSDRVAEDFYGIDLLTDVLSNGPSSRLYQRLLKEQELFSVIDCYISGTIEAGLLIIEAKPIQGVSLEKAREVIWKELDQLKNEKISSRELEKVQNKVVSTLLFSEVSVLNKAINLAFFEALGKVELINQEAALYHQVTSQEILTLANRIFVEENCSELRYVARESEINKVRKMA